MSDTRRRITFSLIFCGLLVAAYFVGSAADDTTVPSNEPDRIILTWTGDPATTQAVTWRTAPGTGDPVAEIAVSEDGPKFPDSAREVAATSETVKTDDGPAVYHTVEFTGLTPRTLYAYRVGDGEDWSEWNQFQTTSEQPAPLTFLYVGDAQNDIYSMWSRVIRMGFTKAPEARFIIHAGDLVNHGDRDREWGEWFRAAGWINRSISSIPSPGNHEYNSGELSPYWRPAFALPRNGPEGLEETAYYLDIQGVRIVSLNSNRRQEEQAVWLDKILAENPNRWTILTFHHPIFSSARGRDNAELRAAWQPVIDRHGVDLVLQGHDHTYGRSNLITGLSAQEGGHGTVYVVSVSGPKMYRNDQEEWMARAAQDTQLFQVIHVDGDRLSYEARTARGVVYDAFELHQRDGQPNELINRIPNTPARLSDWGLRSIESLQWGRRFSLPRGS